MLPIAKVQLHDSGKNPGGSVCFSIQFIYVDSPPKKHLSPSHDPCCIIPFQHLPLLLLFTTTSSHFFHSLLLSKIIRSLTAFLGQSKPISASSFKHICHPVRCSENVLAVHTQHVEQTGILTSSRADHLLHTDICLPICHLCTPWHDRLIWNHLFFDNYNKNKCNAVNGLFSKHSKAWAKYKLKKNVNHIVSPLVNFGTSSSLLLLGMNVQILK